MIAYISGPITGHDDYRETFQKADEALNARGIITVNPAANELGPDATWADYMRHDLAQLLACDAIFMLPDWSRSHGAALERHIAVQLGMTVLDGSAPA